MATCTVRWRPSGGKSASGGRGEFEVVPAETLLDRSISVLFEPLDLTIPAEVTVLKESGKSRIRKFDAKNSE